MSKKNRNKNSQAETYQPPRWLANALRISRDETLFRNAGVQQEQLSSAFRHRCHEASEVALTLARLREERQRVGFVPLPLADYVEGLAKLVGASLPPVLAWLDIADLSQPDPDSAGAFVRFAQELGLSLREILIHVRISFAVRFGSAPIPILIAQRRSGRGRRSQLEECEAVLEQLESECDPKTLREIRRIESEIRVAYNTFSD